MKGAVVTFLALYVVAVTCSAHVLSQETKKAEEGGLKVNLGKEVTLVGEILVETAETLAKDDLKQDDEYFLRDLWEKAKDTLKNAGRKIHEVTKTAVGDMKTAMEQATSRIREKAIEKAMGILAKVMGNAMESYAAEDSGAATQFRNDLVHRLKRTGEKFIAAGKKLSGH
ncbi:uncharacterized protein [Dermacentor albipictus]|uniref:uncharacterized protein n=1 Tax=Dermacentor albipictus TaxID=60249 RepID=UPI0031FD82EB